jgi:acetyl esterase/lipase
MNEELLSIYRQAGSVLKPNEHFVPYNEKVLAPKSFYFGGIAFHSEAEM